MRRLPRIIGGTFALFALFAAAPGSAQDLPVPYPTPDAPGADEFTTTYVRLGPDTEGLLLEPVGESHDIGMVFSHPNADNFGERPGWYMVRRGYPVMLVNHRGSTASDDLYLGGISLGIRYLRERQGLPHVVLLTHSGGGSLGALYQNVAENGASACNGPEKLYPCRAAGLDDLEPADAIVLMDSTLGAGHRATGVDPAITDAGRDPALDMFAAANGFNANAKADYPDEFIARFYREQSRRNNALIDAAVARLRAIEAGQGTFSNDEPLVIRGIGLRALGQRLYQPDTDLQAHTKAPHLLLRADGTDAQVVIESVREPATGHLRSLEVLGSMNADTTVRDFLANFAVRTTDNFAMTADDVTGIDWASSYTSSPSNAEGITVPALVLTMSCHYLVVPGEIIYEHLASKDKTYASVEGASHGFYPCREEFGDTVARTFDYVDRWTRSKFGDSDLN